jgi:trk system potassium uptake protein TrkA
MTVEPNSWLVDNKIRELDELSSDSNFLVAMIFRERRVIIPRGEDMLQSGDHLYIMVPSEHLENAFDFFGLRKVDKVQRVFVLGGKQLGIEAALRLEAAGVQVKLFEREYERCQKIATLIHDAVVVHADGTDQRVLAEENISGIDAYLALTGDDEVNIIASLLAKRMGCQKAIALVNRIDFMPMAQLLGINSTFSTRLVVVDRILRYIRKGNVVSVTTFREEEAEAIELVATPGSKYVGKFLKDLSFPKGLLVGAIVRSTGEVEVPRGDSIINLDDHVIFFCLEHLIQKLEKSFIF